LGQEIVAGSQGLYQRFSCYPIFSTKIGKLALNTVGDIAIDLVYAGAEWYAQEVSKAYLLYRNKGG
jgi:hypothetical protein